MGLLPAPRAEAPNRFLYDERHVQGLRLIRLLRERRGLSLAAIAAVLPELGRLERQEAFRPEMWDRVVGRRLPADPRAGARARLVEAAVDAFSRHGYADVVVDDLCRAAGLAKGSFYRHFGSKEELFFAAASAAVDEVAGQVASGTSRRRVSARAAADLVAPALRRRLPLFLELLARALQGRPGYRQAARDVLSGLAAAIGGRLRGAGDPLQAGMAVVRDAVGRAAAGILEPEPLVEERAAT